MLDSSNRNPSATSRTRQGLPVWILRRIVIACTTTFAMICASPPTSRGHEEIGTAAEVPPAPPVDAPLPAFSSGTGSSLLSADGFSVPIGDIGRLRLSAETKFGMRYSSDEERVLPIPLPPRILPPDGKFALRPPDAGASFEVQNVALAAEANFGSFITARTNVHFIDLYNRNPTSTSDEIRVREAWVRFGKDLAALVPIAGTGGYVELGRSPRFTKQINRRLESYGLWGTALARFEEDQIQGGMSIGEHFYVKGSIANGNPLFFRDVNALAGDNGTSNRSRTNVPQYESGFPILYDAFPNDVNFDGEFQYGGGAGVRFLDDDGRDGVDVLGWYFTRELEKTVSIDGSFYGGDLDLLQVTPAELEGAVELDSAVGLPFSGDRKWETGLNVEGRYGGFRVFGQYIFQSIANLERSGFEAEVAYRHVFGGLWEIGGLRVINWIQPDVRYSNINCRFQSQPLYPSPSTAWNWHKYDLGVRVGIVRGVDFTVEYARTDTVKRINLNEFLATMRIAL